MLVSVIIPCYNHAAYLSDAINSVIRQTYPHIEIIVVDDGSTDETKAVAAQFPGITYLYQENQGLSAARNTGVNASQGSFLVFLDADDWLYEDAIAYNIGQLRQHPEAAFVSGAHDLIDSDQKGIREVVREVKKQHYLHLLEGNYIGMHATVMYRREIFDEYRYDTTLRACEDYDLYLKVARKHPVLHHTKKLAAYRLHGSNMSANFSMMLQQSLLVLKRQFPLLRNHLEREAYDTGVHFWKKYYCDMLFVRLRTGEIKPSKEHMRLLKRHKPVYYFRYQIMRLF